MARTKVHTIYKDKNGKRLPGTTTITGILGKPALIHWAWDLGIKGIDYKKFRDDKADIGSLAHYLIMCHLKKETPDTSDYTANQISQAENALLSFWEWEKSHPMEPVVIEEPMTSEQYRYGGTADLVCKMNGELCLVDFKTGKGIYPEMLYQLAAYRQILKENGHEITNSRILRIGRTEDEGFEERPARDLDKQWRVFLACLEVYTLQKEIKKEEK